MDMTERLQVDAAITFYYNMDTLLTQMEDELKRFKAMRAQVQTLTVPYRSPSADRVSHGNAVSGDSAILNAICKQETQQDGINARIEWLTNRMSKKLRACNIIQEIIEQYSSSQRYIIEMYYRYEGMTTNEIYDITGTDPQYLRKKRSKLRTDVYNALKAAGEI